MKTAHLLLGALMSVCKLQAGPSVDWISDSYDSFNVVLSGTGLGWSGTITSPSGLWQLSSANLIYYPVSEQNSSKVSIENVGTATFLGALLSQFPKPDPTAFPPFNTASIGTYGGYQDYFNPSAPISDENPLVSGYLAGLGWAGTSAISITSMPNVNNTSSWTWTAMYSACGNNLETPEPNTISFGVQAAIIGMAYRFRKSLKHDGPFSNAVKNVLFRRQIPVVVRSRASQFGCRAQAEAAHRDARGGFLPQPANSGPADRRNAQSEAHGSHGRQTMTACPKRHEVPESTMQL